MNKTKVQPFFFLQIIRFFKIFLIFKGNFGLQGKMKERNKKNLPALLNMIRPLLKQVILSALRPLTCNSTWPQHTLQMFADHYGPRQTIPWETINQGLLQPQGELYPTQTIFNHRSLDQLLEFRTSFYETIIAVSSLSKGISSTLNFHESILASPPFPEIKCLHH